MLQYKIQKKAQMADLVLVEELTEARNRTRARYLKVSCAGNFHKARVLLAELLRLNRAITEAEGITIVND